jgi:hypothetical protein
MADQESKDIRMYYYNGYSILNKMSMPKMHRSKSYSEAVAKIKLIREKGKFTNSQLILIDYSVSPSKIILINDAKHGN